MKKGLRGFLLVAGVIFSFISCENFLNGNELKKQLEAEIEYANANSFSVRVMADNGTGSIVTGAGDKTVKAGDSLNLEFDVIDGYKFLYWTAIDKDNGNELLDFVKFTPKDKEVTVAKILKEGNISIKPVCAVRPAVTKFAPADNLSGEPKNSTIIIEFNQELSSQNDLSKISVSINGDSILKHFKEPVIEGKVIKILPDNKNPIDTFEGTKVVTVRIPYDFFYIYGDNTKITLGENNLSDKVISYTINSSTNEKTKVNFQAPVTEAGTMTPTGSDNYSLGKILNLEFKETPEYKFCGWNAENGTDVVKIANADSAITTIQVLEASTSEVKVSPKVYKRPAVSGFAPDTVSATAAASVPKDSDIKIIFDHELSSSNDLSGIAITISGDDVSSNFEEPLLEGNTILIKAKMDAPSLFISGTRTVNVRIPANLYYETEDGNKIEAGVEDFQYRYTINTNSKVQAKVDFAMTENSGILSQTGTKTYNYGDEVEISFTENSAYQFVKWEVKNNIAEDESVIVEIADQKSAKTTLKIKGQSEENRNVEIKAVCVERPVVKIHFTTEHGSTVPNEDRTYYSNEKFNIRYEENSDYAFTGWKVLRNVEGNADDNEDFPLEFDSSEQKNTDVTVKALEKDVNITLIAECAKRPKIVSNSPTMAAGSVFRDRTIVVMFDKKMNPESIYYTEKEKEELENNPEIELMKNESGKAYGYYKKNDTTGSSIVYKNIRITRLDDENKNLLKYYGEPIFDKNNAGTLRIPTKITKVDNDGNPIQGKDEAPPKNTEILVTFDKGMSYLSNSGKEIGLDSEFSWTYLTNKKTDATAPEFTKINIKKYDKNQPSVTFTDLDSPDFRTYYFSETDTVNADLLVAEEIRRKNELITNNVSDIKEFNVDTGYLWIKAEVVDEGSGPSQVSANFIKKHNEYYSTLDQNDEFVKSFILDMDVNGPNGEIDQKIDLEEVGLSEGLYALSFTVKDANGHISESNYSYEFIYDVVPPATLTGFSEKRKESGKANILWNMPENNDFEKFEIKIKNTNDDSQIFTPEVIERGYDGINSKELNVIDYNRYAYTARVYDVAGNYSETEITDKVAPGQLKDFIESRTESNKALMKWTKPKEEDFGKVILTYQNVDDLTAEPQTVEVEKEFVSKELSVLDFNHYEYSAVVVDYSGNKSDPVKISKDKIAPSLLLGLSEKRTKSGKASLSWTRPKEQDFAEIEIEVKNATTKVDMPAETVSYTNMDNAAEVSVIDYNRYEYKARVRDFSGNWSGYTDIVTDNVAPAKLKGLSETRSISGKASIKWTKPGDIDFGKLEVAVRNATDNGEWLTYTYDYTTSSENEILVENLKRYEYKARVYDFSGNVTDYTDIVTDTTPPESLSEVYSGGRNGNVDVYIDVPKTIDYYYIEVTSGGTTTNIYPTKGQHYKYRKAGTNGTSYSFSFKTVDYSGNKSSAVIVSQKAGVLNGMICYSNSTDGFFVSENYYNKGPIGVICDNSNLSAVKIWDLTEATGYCWGKNDDPCSDEVLKNTWNGSRNTASGLEWYNYIKNNKSFHINYQNGSKNNCHTIWYYLENVKNVNSPVTWYIPGVTEFNGIIANYYAMQNSYNLLNANGHSVTLFTEQKPYWTSCPRYKKPYANAVMLNKWNDGIYVNIATNEGLTLYLSGEYKEDSWYYKDEWQCEKSGNQAALITHAMAQVNLSN